MQRKYVLYLPRLGSLPSYFVRALYRVSEEKGFDLTLFTLKKKPTIWHGRIAILPFFLRISFFRFFYERFFLISFLRKKGYSAFIFPSSVHPSKKARRQCVFFSFFHKPADSKKLSPLAIRLIKHGSRLITSHAMPELQRYFIKRTHFMHQHEVLYCPWYKCKEEITQKEVEGLDHFFLCYCPPNSYQEDIVYLLRAFSWFKRRQRSSIKLVLCLHNKQNILPHLHLEQYAYYSELHIVHVESVDQCVHLYKKAYAVIYPFDVHRTFSIPALELGLQLEVPLLAHKDDYTSELLSDAALYFDKYVVSSLSQSLSTIFADEEERESLIAATINLKKQRFQHTKVLSGVLNSI